MCSKKFVESDLYIWCRNAPVEWNSLWFDECAVYWYPLHDGPHLNPFSRSPNANIRRISINNRLDKITNHRYPWSVCFDMFQFTANLANQMWRINKWHIHSNYTHFFTHTMRESWCMTYHKYVPRIMWTQLEWLKLQLASGKLWWIYDRIAGSFSQQGGSTDQQWLVHRKFLYNILFHNTVPIFEHILN